MPGDAPIEGLALTALNGLILTFSDIERMKKFGQAILDGQTVVDTLGVSVMGASKVVSTDDEQQQDVVEVVGAPTETMAKAESLPVPMVEAPVLKNLFLDDLFADAPAPTTSEVAAASEVPVVDVAAVDQTVETKIDVPMVRVVKEVKETKAVKPMIIPVVPPVATRKPRRITF